MKSSDAVEVLGALAQENRLAVYRLLVQVGPEGLPASDIAERLTIAAPTLSFHLKALSHAGLVSARQDGRYIIYSANYVTMDRLLEYLNENCCGEASCAPDAARPRKRPAQAR